MTLITGQVADVGMNNASGVFYARAAEFRGDGPVVVTPAPAIFVVKDGAVSADIAPGPTLLTLHVGPVRKDWFVNVPETDVGLGDLIATYTTYEPAVVSAAIAARDAAIEAESEAKQAAIDAEAKRVAAETAAGLTGADRLHVDGVRALLDETYDQSQAGMALPPRLTETALNDTYTPATMEPVNAARYVTADGTTDDTAALNEAADAARLGQSLNLGTRALTLPAEKSLYINGAVDLRYIINVNLIGRIRVGPNGVIILGHNSVQRPGQQVQVRDVQHATTDQTNVCLRFIGLKQAQVHIGRCSNVELLADDSAADTASLAYNTFHLGSVARLHLKGIGPQGWITQNLFLGGTIFNLSITGQYGHNENTWIKPTLEGGTVDIQTGVRNRFMDSRCEAGTQVTFGAATSRNVIEDSFVSNPRTRQPGAVVVSDEGTENIVTSTPDLYARAYEVAQFDALTAALDSACEFPGQGIRPGLSKVQPRGVWQYVVDTGVVPIGPAPSASGESYSTSWKLRRFQIASDEQWFRPYITLFDAAGNNVTAGGMSVTTSWGLATDNGVESYTTSGDQKLVEVLITSQIATHARIRVRASGTIKPFQWLRLTAFTNAPSTSTGVESMRRMLRQPLYQSAKPTQGVAPLGTVVQGPSASWKVTARADSTLAAEAPAGTSVTVASATGIAAGDVIGVLLADGTTHWTTVASLSGTTLTLTAATPSVANAGARVSTVRWT